MTIPLGLNLFNGTQWMLALSVDFDQRWTNHWKILFWDHIGTIDYWFGAHGSKKSKQLLLCLEYALN